ncbi:MAG: ammonia-forming cytochrome c nitrite reductase subunit c552 [Pirellulaceae bacterium]|nr:ammonia-forming cytochrome c nitrite reductase subunit c552 [Pirellulaceae bacterium]
MAVRIKFASVFIAIFIGTAMIASSILLTNYRPAVETNRVTAAAVRATGECAACHRHETSSVVHQFEMSRHAAANVTCLDCHMPVEGQEELDHHNFTITTKMTSKNCASCHQTEYDQYLRSRHGAPAWAAVAGSKDFTAEQIEFAESHHPGTIERPFNQLSILEGPAAISAGCMNCHDIGKPNDDGSIGNCTDCHARHSTSIALARQPETCGQCHMGPDHSQLEIYHESKHGVLFHLQKKQFDLSADPTELSTADMSVPTCATCHMSGIEGLKTTHDTTERLSWFLFAATSEKRDHYKQGQTEMKETCLKCHTAAPIDAYYEEAEAVVHETNAKVEKAKALMDSLYEEGLLTPEPFDEPIEFLYFDYWHYYGRTAKHGAFMGGADFVQWHGNYELLKIMKEMEEMAEELRKHKGENETGEGDR